MTTPTRLVNGVTTAPKGRTLGNYRVPVPIDLYQNFDDFDKYTAGEWTVTNTTSHATIGLVDGTGGLLKIVGGASSVTNDIGAVQKASLDINIPVNTGSSSYPPSAMAWFFTGIKATTAANDQIQAGIATSMAALTPTDGIYFNKAAGASTVQFVVRKSSASLAATAYSTGTTTVATMTNGTPIKLGWVYGGGGYIEVFVDDSMVCRVDVGGSTGTVAATFPQAVYMGYGVGLKAAATAPTTGDVFVDFLLASQDRTY